MFCNCSCSGTSACDICSINYFPTLQYKVINGMVFPVNPFLLPPVEIEPKNKSTKTAQRFWMPEVKFK